MEADLSKYIGKWIVINNQKVVSSGISAKKVFNEAKDKYPHEKLLLVRVPEKETMIFQLQ